MKIIKNKWGEDMKEVQLKDLPKSTRYNPTFFKRTPDANKEWTKEHYVRDEGWNRYSCGDPYDINHEIFLKGSTKVYVNYYG